jgi:FAD/FMN-containing dehydrogenase
MTVFYGGFDRRPALIVRPADAGEAAHAVSVARQTGLELAIRSGGHSVAGHGSPLRHPHRPVYTRPVLRPVNVSSISRRADQLHAVVGAGVKRAVHADVGRVDQVLVGHQADAGQVRMTSGMVSTSAVVATVVATCTIRSGRSGSQVR